MSLSLKRVSAFQTSDNQTFPNKLQALNHEFRLALRGRIQTRLAEAGNKGMTVTTTDIAAVLAADADNIAQILKTHTVAINRARGEANKVKVI